MLLGQEVHYYMVYIAYFTELNLQICDYAQKRRICRENCKFVFDENFHGHFCPPRKAAKFCHPDENRNGTIQNLPRTMKNRPGTMKNQPGTMKNQNDTMKNYENRPGAMKTNLEP